MNMKTFRPIKSQFISGNDRDGMVSFSGIMRFVGASDHSEHPLRRWRWKRTVKIGQVLFREEQIECSTVFVDVRR